MADEWYYTRQGQQRGPVSMEELQQLAASQQLLPTDLLWKEGLIKWVPARTAKTLFPEDTTATAPASLPLVPDQGDLPEEDLRPAGQRRRLADDDGDDRPRRRRPREDEADDLDERPRRRQRTRSGGQGLLIGLIIGGVALLLFGGVAVVVLIVVLTRPGGAGISGSYAAELAPGSKQERQLFFKAGYRTQIWVDSSRRGPGVDVDIFVFTTDGRQVAFDDRFDADAYVEFIAPTTGNYRVSIQNPGQFPTRANVRYRQ